jgi:hypothetical protein
MHGYMNTKRKQFFRVVTPNNEILHFGRFEGSVHSHLKLEIICSFEASGINNPDT